MQMTTWHFNEHLVLSKKGIFCSIRLTINFFHPAKDSQAIPLFAQQNCEVENNLFPSPASQKISPLRGIFPALFVDIEGEYEGEEYRRRNRLSE